MYKYSISYYGATSGCISFLPRLTFSRLKGKAKKKGLLVIWAVACIEQSHAAVSDDSNPQPFTFLNSDFTIVLVASYQCAGRLGFAQSKWNVRSFVFISRYVVVKHWATLKFTNDLRSIILFQIVRKLFDYLKTSCQPPNVGKTNARLEFTFPIMTSSLLSNKTANIAKLQIGRSRYLKVSFTEARHSRIESGNCLFW